MGQTAFSVKTDFNLFIKKTYITVTTITFKKVIMGQPDLLHIMTNLHVQEKQHSELRASSSSLVHKKPAKVLAESVVKKKEPFVQEDVLTGIYNVCTLTIIKWPF